MEGGYNNKRVKPTSIRTSVAASSPCITLVSQNKLSETGKTLLLHYTALSIVRLISTYVAAVSDVANANSFTVILQPRIRLFKADRNEPKYSYRHSSVDALLVLGRSVSALALEVLQPVAGGVTSSLRCQLKFAWLFTALSKEWNIL